MLQFVALYKNVCDITKNRAVFSNVLLDFFGFFFFRTLQHPQNSSGTQLNLAVTPVWVSLWLLKHLSGQGSVGSWHCSSSSNMLVALPATLPLELQQSRQRKWCVSVFVCVCLCVCVCVCVCEGDITAEGVVLEL